jgi:hypothetical protein
MKVKSTLPMFRHIPPAHKLTLRARNNGRLYYIRLRSRDVGVDEAGRTWFVTQGGEWHGHLTHMEILVGDEVEETKIKAL